MTGSKDLLEQFSELTEDRREKLIELLFESTPLTLHPFLMWKRRQPDFPSIVRTPNVCGGSPRLIRTRIPIWLLQQMRIRGFTDAKILECYPTLTASDLVQAWGYVAAHSTEIDREIAENEQY